MARSLGTATFLGWLVLGWIWGSTWLFIRVGLRDLPPFTFAGLRFVLALVPLLIFCLWRRIPWPKRRGDWGLMVGTGLLTIGWNYGWVFWAGRFISAGQTATLHATLPLFALVFAHFLVNDERMTWRSTVGVLLGMLGTGVIFARELSMDREDAVWASGAVILAAFGMAYANVLIKARGPHLHPVPLTVVQMASGAVPLLLIGWASEPPLPSLMAAPRSLVCLAYLAFVGSSFAFVLMFWLIRRMPVTLTQLTPFVSTVTAVALGAVCLDEVVTIPLLGGCAD